MRLPWTSTRRSPIAIDFGTAQLKMLQLSPGPTPQLVAAGAIDVPQDLRDDAPALLAFHTNAIRQLLDKQPFKGRRAVAATTGLPTLVQHLQLSPSDDPSAIHAQVTEELRDRLNLDPARLVVRCFPGEVITRNSAPRQEVIVIASPRQDVMRHIHVAAQVGLEMTDLLCQPQAILHAFAHLYRRAADVDTTTCFIDLGAQTTHVVLAHGHAMVAAKSIHIDLTHAATSAPLAAASNTLPRHAAPGLALLEAEPQPDDTPLPRDEGYDYLIDELQLCLRYYHGMYADRAVDKLVFLGGAAHDHPRCQCIARTLGITAQLGDPLARLGRPKSCGQLPGLDMRQPQPGWAVAMGLCISQGA